jgi:hypothetical protein
VQVVELLCIDLGDQDIVNADLLLPDKIKQSRRTINLGFEAEWSGHAVMRRGDGEALADSTDQVIVGAGVKRSPGAQRPRLRTWLDFLTHELGR